jgi:hypothetical protein
MKIALHIPFGGRFVAEKELAPRMVRAFQTLGHEASVVFTADEINGFSPDFVLALHQFAAKTTAYPTYGCLWSPCRDLDNDAARHSVATYDGYFSASPVINQWVAEVIQRAARPESIGLLLPTTNRTPFEPGKRLRSGEAEVAYFGANWDGERHRPLFEKLDVEGFMAFYGSAPGWSYLRNGYRGSVAFDGEGVIAAIREAGAGLCLHRPEHTEAGIPSMRIFEIAAAGAVAICGRHPFIEEVFGDAALYIDPGADAEEQARSIRQHWSWIRGNAAKAVALAERTHAIGLGYSLEELLPQVIAAHHGVAERVWRLRADEAIARLDAVIGSRSWLLTAPYRVAGLAMRRVRNRLRQWRGAVRR